MTLTLSVLACSHIVIRESAMTWGSLALLAWVFEGANPLMLNGEPFVFPITVSYFVGFMTGGIYMCFY